MKSLEDKGWELEYEKDKIIGLRRENQKITTEPGFQYELSGAPFKNIHSVCSENSSHFNELKKFLILYLLQLLLLHTILLIN